MENTVYWEGFAKAAEAHGVDPAVLVKIAWQIPDYGQWLVSGGRFLRDTWNKRGVIKDNAKEIYRQLTTPTLKKNLKNVQQLGGVLEDFKGTDLGKMLSSGYGKLKGYYGRLTPAQRYALGGFALSALGGAIFSNGSFYDRLMRGLGYGAVGGLGAYGLKRTGALDKGIQAMRNYKNRLMAPAQVQKTQGTDLSNYDQQVAERLAGNQ